MQTFAQTIAPNAAFKSMSASCKRGRSTVVVRAHRVHDVANQVGKFAAVAAVTFALTMVSFFSMPLMLHMMFGD